jgi:arylsulfatase A-like enzyme
MGAVASGMAAASLQARGAERRPPNIIFAFSDEHRWQSMQHSELPEMQTPHMARLASQGLEFTHCISNYPVCSPYRGILLSGQWPQQQGVIDNSIPLDPKDAAFPKAFQRAGYRTGYVGKWHLGGTRAEPFGFDDSLIWTKTNAHWDKSIYHPAEGEPVRPEGYNATLMTDQALDYMRAHREEPFFLMLSLNPPHASFLDPPEEKKALYPEGSLPRRANTDFSRLRGTEQGGAFSFEWEHYQGYHAHVSAIDDQVGRLMAELDALGLTEDTILVYSSDHGSMLGSHGVGSKRQPYEESIRVPFIIRWPGVIPSGKQSRVLFGAIDIAPTLCGLAGVPIPEVCPGQDFSPTLRGGRGPRPSTQFIMHIAKDNSSGGENHPAPIFRGVRSNRHTYAVLRDGTEWLFDNEDDPYQQTNLADVSAARKHVLALRRQLRKHLGRAGDDFPIPT